MRTVRCSGRLSCHACPPCHTCPLPCTPPPHMYPPPPPWTEFLTHACENITLPQTTVADGNERTHYFIRYRGLVTCGRSTDRAVQGLNYLLLFQFVWPLSRKLCAFVFVIHQICIQISLYILLTTAELPQVWYVCRVKLLRSFKLLPLLLLNCGVICCCWFIEMWNCA